MLNGNMMVFNIIIVSSILHLSYGYKPNVLLIVVDDLRPALGVYGDENAYTPNIDKLSEYSFVFTNAFAQQALCAPSRNSFLTSRRPDSLHLYDFYSYWRDSVGNFTTLPQLFKENGYYTHSIGKVFHPGISSNNTDDAKYSWSETPYHPPTEQFKEAKVCPNKDGHYVRNLLCPVIVEEQPGGSLPDLQSLNEALNFLQYHKNSEAPFFLAVGFHKPHIPIKFPVEYLEFHPIHKVKLPYNYFRPPLLPVVAWNPWIDIRSRDDVTSLNLSFPFGPMPEYFTRRIIQNYNAAVTYIDHLIGQLLKKVDDKTIVVLLGDHGWSIGEHGEFAKYSNFDIATRVPLLIHVPYIRASKIICSELVELVDLFPTLVELTQISDSLEVCLANGLNSKLCTEGKSLVPLMTSRTKYKIYKGKKAVFNQYPRPGPYPTQKPNSDEPLLKQITIMGYSIRTMKHRYTEWVKFNHSTFKPDWSKVGVLVLLIAVCQPTLPWATLTFKKPWCTSRTLRVRWSPLARAYESLVSPSPDTLLVTCAPSCKQVQILYIRETPTTEAVTNAKQLFRKCTFLVDFISISGALALVGSNIVSRITPHHCKLASSPVKTVMLLHLLQSKNSKLT